MPLTGRGGSNPPSDTSASSGCFVRLQCPSVRYVRRMRRRFVTAVVVGMCAATFLASPAAADADGPVVETANGPVVGVVDGGIEVFRGIPYAAAPVGDLRYEAPQPVGIRV